MKAALLDFKGTALALAFGLGLLLLGGWQYLAMMLVFLFASVAVTKHGYEEKRELGIYEHERSWENVLANGIVPFICVVFLPIIGPWPFIGSLAAITADKFGSELGVLSDDPVSLGNFKKVKRGVSGAISKFGTLMSFDGALLIGACSYFVFPGISIWKVLAIALVGFLVCIADSLIGILEEKGIGNKATTNLACSAVGAFFGFFVLTTIA